MSNPIQINFKKISNEIILGFNKFIEKTPLKLECSISINHKTISEIGGRIIEEYVLLALRELFIKSEDYDFENLSSKSLGDFALTSTAKDFVKLFFDVKAQHISIREKTQSFYLENGIKQSKPGESHPNLISYQKAVDFFTDDTKYNDDICMLFIKYDPIIENRIVNFNILPLDQNSILLLRNIADKNLSYGNLGKGQIQLYRLYDIITIQRTKIEFVKFINKLKNKPRKILKTSKV